MSDRRDSVWTELTGRHRLILRDAELRWMIGSYMALQREYGLLGPRRVWMKSLERQIGDLPKEELKALEVDLAGEYSERPNSRTLRMLRWLDHYLSNDGKFPTMRFTRNLPPSEVVEMERPMPMPHNPRPSPRTGGYM